VAQACNGQFQIFYKSGADQLEYQPDFMTEMERGIYMLEAKARNEMTDSEVLAKRDAAVKWCRHASDHATSYGGKPWTYLLIPRTLSQRTLQSLALRLSVVRNKREIQMSLSCPSIVYPLSL